MDVKNLIFTDEYLLILLNNNTYQIFNLKLLKITQNVTDLNFDYNVINILLILYNYK